MMPSESRSPSLIAVAALALCVVQLTAQKPARPAVEWARLTAPQTERAVELFRAVTGPDEEARTKAEQELVAMGTGIAPLAIRRLVDSEPNHNDRMAGLLDQITTREHTPLLARLVKDTRAAARAYAVLRLASFRDPELSPVFLAAATDKSKDVAFHGALGSLGLGDFRGFELVQKHASEDWARSAGRIAAVLQGSASEATALALLERLAKVDGRQAVGCLRLFRYLGVKEAAHALKGRLESEDFNVKKEAINALRVVVDGAPPLENLSVFQAIEVAKHWQGRL